MGDQIRVIGIGNPDRGDDGVGPVVAAAVAARVGPATEVTASTSDPSRLIERWAGADSVILIDAIVDGTEPGTIRVIDGRSEIVPDDAGALSSHGMGVGAAVSLSRSLGSLPDRVTVVGISASAFEGSGLSDPVEQAVERATDIVMEMVQHA